MGTPGLYIHIPFCLRKCAYCDFYSTTQTGLIAEYLAAVKREMALYRDEFAEFDTIYLGGGTPSLLKTNQVAELLDHIHTTFTILPGAEITVEANPADLDLGAFKDLRAMGINRLTVGVQSFHDEELALLGRRHTAEQAIRTIEDARAAGFANIGLDLIYCLPGQTLVTWRESLHRAIELRQEHISCYELELKADTPLGARLARGEITPASEEQQHEFFLATSETLEAAGFVHYEVSNFALGLEMASRHNQKYWDHTPYLGLGPSAHSFQENRRWWNHASLEDYLRALKEGRRPMAGSELLGPEEMYSEILMLAFRTRKGIDLHAFSYRFGRDLLQEHAQVLEQFRRAGLIIIESGYIRPTRAGLAVADALARL